MCIIVVLLHIKFELTYILVSMVLTFLLCIGTVQDQAKPIKRIINFKLFLEAILKYKWKNVPRTEIHLSESRTSQNNTEWIF